MCHYNVKFIEITSNIYHQKLEAINLEWVQNQKCQFKLNQSKTKVKCGKTLLRGDQLSRAFSFVVLFANIQLYDT